VIVMVCMVILNFLSKTKRFVSTQKGVVR